MDEKLLQMLMNGPPRVLFDIDYHINVKSEPEPNITDSNIRLSIFLEELLR